MEMRKGSCGPDECPECGLWREKARESLREPRGSDNYLLALHARSNCRACRAAIALPVR